MACFHPIKAWQAFDGGSPVFSEPAGKSWRALSLPCGQCTGCRLEYSRQWAMRCMHEAHMHEWSSFITLTYDDAAMELASGSLVYDHFQKFIRDLRYRYYGQKIKYYVAGEYGDQFGRPHFHACLFGVHFRDRKYFKTLPSGFKLYTSDLLSDVWGRGFCSVGDVSFESAAYVARYCMKKVTGNNAEIHYNRVDMRTGECVNLEPEFSHMSLNPAIGKEYAEKYAKEIYPSDTVVINGRTVKPPRYYDQKVLNDVDRFGDEIRISVEVDRLAKAKKFEDNNTAERLNVREIVTKARLSLAKRGLI